MNSPLYTQKLRISAMCTHTYYWCPGYVETEAYKHSEPRGALRRRRQESGRHSHRSSRQRAQAPCASAGPSGSSARCPELPSSEPGWEEKLMHTAASADEESHAFD